MSKCECYYSVEFVYALFMQRIWVFATNSSLSNSLSMQSNYVRLDNLRIRGSWNIKDSREVKLIGAASQIS